MQPGPIDDGTRRFADITNASICRHANVSICRHSECVMGTDTNPYAAIVSTVALKRHILLASLIFEIKIALSLPIANHARPIFS